jgi:Chlorophyllase enzyme
VITGRGWTGAAWGLCAGTGAILTAKMLIPFAGRASVLAAGLGVPLGMAMGAAGGLAIVLVARLLALLPARYRFALAGSVFLLSTQIFSGAAFERFVPTLWLVACSTVVGGAAAVLLSWRSSPASRAHRLLACTGLAGGLAAAGLGLAWLLAEGSDDPPAVDAAACTAVDVRQLDLPDPSRPGERRVLRLFYGSGTDRRRPEYGEHVDLRTRPVDGARFLEGWSGLDGWTRTRYWGFDAHAMPLDGRVFYPEGAGPFPLVLVVHGGHPMMDFSEPGYDYLCEHLASHGFICASVDENFLNGGALAELAGGVSGENAARGWLLLEHLRAFRGFNEDAETPLHGKVDLGRVALVGHSKGGEAIAVAALWNRLPADPADATRRFDYGFGIRALIALSTTDKQYRPAGAGIALEGIDYLALQGSNDGDVESFQGAEQYDRVKLAGPDGGYHFKAAVYVHRANHGQWSTVWAQHDKTRIPKRLYFNRKPLLPAAAQEQVARAYATAFLSASLGADRRYLPFVEDPRAGRSWLPDTIYLARFEDSTRQYVARFDEDVDVTTTTLPGGRIRSENLTIWREQPAAAPSLWGAVENRAAYLGWDSTTGKTASFAVALPPGLGARGLGPGAALVFALADAHEPPNSKRRRGLEPSPRQPIDLDVEVADGEGHAARLPLDHVRLLQAQLETSVWKAGLRLDRRREIVFQTFAIPLSSFVAQSPGLDLGDLRAVRFVFDRTPEGVVVLDDLGFAPPRLND